MWYHQKSTAELAEKITRITTADARMTVAHCKAIIVRENPLNQAFLFLEYLISGVGR